jgi:outer membrane protein assembly factor BamD (BamD/ComL family)
MKSRTIIFIFLISILTFSCNKSNKMKVEEITKLEKEVLSTKMTRLDTVKASRLILKYDQFVKEFPKDTLAPIYLFRASDLSMNMQRGNQAINYLDKIINEYPKFNKAEECMFLKGYIAENVMHNLSFAADCYRNFIKEYPTHPLAKDAEASLKNLGKTPEQLVAEFEANQKGESTDSKK